VKYRLSRKYHGPVPRLGAQDIGQTGDNLGRQSGSQAPGGAPYMTLIFNFFRVQQLMDQHTHKFLITRLGVALEEFNSAERAIKKPHQPAAHSATKPRDQRTSPHENADLPAGTVQKYVQFAAIPFEKT